MLFWVLVFPSISEQAPALVHKLRTKELASTSSRARTRVDSEARQQSSDMTWKTSRALFSFIRRLFMCVCARVCARASLSLSLSLSACACARACVCVGGCVCVYVYVERERERESERDFLLCILCFICLHFHLLFATLSATFLISFVLLFL